MVPSTTRRRVARVSATVIDASGAHRGREQLAGEEPLEIRVAGPDGAVLWTTSTMRTPGQDFALAAGLLHAEGVITEPGDLAEIRYCTDVDEQQYNVVTVHLRRPPRREMVARTLGATASCGVCGTASIDEVLERLGGAAELGSGGLDAEGPGADAPVDPPTVGHEVGHEGGHAVGREVGHEGAKFDGRERFTIDGSLLAALPDRLRAAQPVFDETGGLHAAGLFDATGGAHGVAEDIGRHNALDKVLGERFLAGGLPATDLVAVVSSRVSFELVQKVAVAGVPVLCAVSAPSSLAVETAQRLGVTLAAFARGDRVTIYAHPERVAAGA